MKIIKTNEDALDNAVYIEELPPTRELCLFCSGNPDDCTGECDVLQPHDNEQELRF